MTMFLWLRTRTCAMGTQLNRLIHTSTVKMSMGELKSNLAKLRKKTGYPFGNCKKALEVNENNLEKAAKWLEDQAKEMGWSKAMKMESRSTPQGLIGIALDSPYAAMVEINCETDFVAKNDKFQKLVDLVAKTCLQHTKAEHPSPKSTSKILLEGGEVGRLALPGDQDNVADQVLRTIGFVGEKLVVRRAALLTAAAPTCLTAFTHPVTNTTTGDDATMMGKYGAVLAYLAANADDRCVNLGKQLCQHIIGMNPMTIESSVESGPASTPADMKTPSPTKDGDDHDDNMDQHIIDKAEEDETVMMRQSFLLDADRTVAEVVAEGGMKMVDFVRFECGESTEDQEEVTTKAAQAGG